METTEPIWDEEKKRQQLVRTSKLLLLICIIYTLWITLLIISVFFFQLDTTWAILTIEQWILSAIVLISIAIILEIILIILFILSKEKQFKLTQPTYIEGKLVHNYTIPSNAKGGIFSKTYILIDENNVLNLRYQMIPPFDLWR